MNRQELPMAGKPLIGVGHRTDIRLLNEEEIRFEIDMCIGCDRCMRACPVPLSTMVNIAELNRATITDEIAPHVARFTDECVMCGSCVPVCPVDNHRDLLMLSLKQRLGIAWDGKVDMGRILGFLPVGWDLPLLLSRLREQPMFSNEQLVGDNYLLHLVATSKLRTLMPGTVLMYEGDFGRDLYFILEGRFELTSGGPAGNELPVAILRRGEYLGEHGMLTGQPRNATTRAQTAALVLEVPEQVMQHLLEIVPALQHFFEQLTIMRSLESMLRQMALFQGVSSVDMRHMAEQTEVKRYERGERLFSEKRAERPAREALHLLLEGFVKVARQTAAGTGQGKSDERIIAYRQGGDYFAGGLDMLGDRRAVTVTTITRTRVAEVPRQVMTALLARYPEVNQRFQERILAYYGANAAANSAVFEPFNFRETGALKNSLSDAEARAGLHSLVGDGVVE
ncbi:MAG TPA: cyclic nucleotide-binding domain-containing protein, partial [Ktedonobacteraceae bacterium]